jgi:hypothetical protein
VARTSWNTHDEAPFGPALLVTRGRAPTGRVRGSSNGPGSIESLVPGRINARSADFGSGGLPRSYPRCLSRRPRCFAKPSEGPTLTPYSGPRTSTRFACWRMRSRGSRRLPGCRPLRSVNFRSPATAGLTLTAMRRHSRRAASWHVIEPAAGHQHPAVPGAPLQQQLCCKVSARSSNAVTAGDLRVGDAAARR